MTQLSGGLLLIGSNPSIGHNNDSLNHSSVRPSNESGRASLWSFLVFKVTPRLTSPERSKRRNSKPVGPAPYFGNFSILVADPAKVQFGCWRIYFNRRVYSLLPKLTMMPGSQLVHDYWAHWRNYPSNFRVFSISSILIPTNRAGYVVTCEALK